MNHPLFQQVFQTISQYDMIREGDSILVGVSGGPDSVTLLHVLVALSESLHLRLGMAHLNHDLRQAAEEDEHFVRSLAKSFGLPVFIEKKDILALQEKTGVSLEETGRDARYSFFNRICQKKGYDKIAVGHHADDNAEQVLLNLLRGSGPAGISGIPPVRENIIRPLIRVSRNQIMAYLKSHGFDYVIDQSNTDPRFVRNRIRHHLIPELKTEYNPKIAESLNRLAMIRQSEEEWISSLVNPLFEQALLHSDARELTLSVSELQQFHPAARRRVLRKAILNIKGDLRRITSLHINSIIHLIAKDDISDARLDLPDRIRILRQTGHLVILKESQNLRDAKPYEHNAIPADFVYSVSRDATESQNALFLPEINCHVTFTRIQREQVSNLTNMGDHIALFDDDAIRFPITIRNFQPGDRFHPLGMNGSQKVKDFFINNKIKPADRGTIPIFAMGDTIIWVGGFRIAHPFKVSQKTRTVLKIEISCDRPTCSAIGKRNHF